MTEQAQKPEPTLDLRHLGRLLDKEMSVERAGMEMAKPGMPDMRRRKFTVRIPSNEPTPGPDDPPQTVR